MSVQEWYAWFERRKVPLAFSRPPRAKRAVRPRARARVYRHPSNARQLLLFDVDGRGWCELAPTGLRPVSENNQWQRQTGDAHGELLQLAANGAERA